MSAIGQHESAMRDALAAEPDWQPLLRHFDFNRGFALILVLVESAENAILCREALGDYLRERGKGSIRLIACNSPEDAQSLPLMLHRPRGLDESQTLWVESAVPEGSIAAKELDEWKTAWRVCFTGLNRIRNNMQNAIRGKLVFAVAPWVQEVIRRFAPDLWSIRSSVVSFSPRIRDAGIESEDVVEGWPFSDPALAPDPEFAEQAAESLRNLPGQELPLARILKRTAEGFLARNDAKNAIRVLVEAQAAETKGFGTSAEIGYTKSLLGRAYKMDAQWSRAKAYFSEALEIDRQRLGDLHPAIASDLGDMANLLVEEYRLTEAEVLYRRALEIHEYFYGPENPKVATDLNNLGVLMMRRGRPDLAEPLYRRALSIVGKAFGEDHPAISSTLSNLAQVLASQGEYGEAEQMMRRTIIIDEKRFGPDHPSVAVRLNNLAGLLWDTARLDEAEAMYRRAWEIDEKSLGRFHPAVAVRLNNLAMILKARGQLDEAESLCRRALQICEGSFGANHPEIARALNNLAGIVSLVGRNEEGEMLYRKAIVILEHLSNNQGTEHPNLEMTKANLKNLMSATSGLPY